MKVDKSNSWKEQIDPAFDDLIKVYLDYIKLTHICSTDKRKRYLFVDDESLKVLESKEYPPFLKEFKPNLKNLKEKVHGFSLPPNSKSGKKAPRSQRRKCHLTRCRLHGKMLKC